MILDENSFRKINKLINTSKRKVEYLILVFKFSNDWIGNLFSEDISKRKIDFEALPSNNYKPYLAIIYQENEIPQKVSKELQSEIDAVFGGNVKNAFDNIKLFSFTEKEMEEVKKRRESPTISKEELKELLKYKYGTIIYDYDKSDYYIDYLPKFKDEHRDNLQKDLNKLSAKEVLMAKDNIEEYENAEINLQHHIKIAINSFTEDKYTQDIFDIIFKDNYPYNIENIRTKLQLFYDNRNRIQELIKKIKEGLKNLDTDFSLLGSESQSGENKANNMHKILKSLIIKKIV